MLIKCRFWYLYLVYIINRFTFTSTFIIQFTQQIINSMEEKPLNEKESLELITRMIKNTHQKLEEGNGIPFLVWGYTSIIVSILVWYQLKITQNYLWNLLWFLIPLIGFPIQMLLQRKRERGIKTYLEKIIKYVWTVIGVAGFVVSMGAMFYWKIPILFIIIVLMATGTAITGLIIQFKPIIISGFVSILLSFGCLIFSHSYSILVFALVFLLMMVIPGHILNFKNRKRHV